MKQWVHPPPYVLGYVHLSQVPLYWTPELKAFARGERDEVTMDLNTQHYYVVTSSDQVYWIHWRTVWEPALLCYMAYQDIACRATESISAKGHLVVKLQRIS